jgi:four helix bundle protein
MNNREFEEKMKHRTKSYAINVWRTLKDYSKDATLRDYTNQTIRSSASTAANYRAACRAKSKADFINKLKIVEEEADETIFFLEVFIEIVPEMKSKFEPLYKEGNEILSIIVKSINTLKNANQT